MASKAKTAVSSSKATRPSDQELVATYNANRQDLQALANKAGELERDADEHKLVIQTLEDTMKTDPDRKCFRMIDSVLVERTVKEVLPALKTTLEKLVETMQGIANAYSEKEKEQNDFVKKWNIQIKNS